MNLEEIRKKIDTIDNNMVIGKLNSRVKKFIEHKLFANEGYRRGLQNSEDVQLKLQMWKSYYLSDALRTEVLDKINITDDEALEYFRSGNKDSIITEVKIVEVLVDNPDTLNIVLEKLNLGTPLKELASEYSIRTEAKGNNGELGYFSITEYGEIGRIAGEMEIGDLYGPLKVPEGFSIFKLVDKRKRENKLPAEFDKEKNQIKMELRYKKFSDIIIDKTVELANKYTVQINQDLIESLKVTNTTSIVYQHLGFGGRLLAVPMTIPNYLWVEGWLNQNKPSL